MQSMIQFVTGIFEVTAVIVCVSWIWVNAYHYYPMIVTSLGSIIGRVTSSGQRATTLSDEELPTVDVLLPAYHESEVIENSIASVRDANYPREKITLAVLVEPDDRETRSKLERIENEYEFTVITVPESYPGESNKPRALNYGFERLEGNIVSITDAEDIVDPDLYRRVAERLVVDDCDYVQGRLDMVNEDDGWMNIMFRAEYGYWYKVNTPAKYHRGYPIPLGGTTCFFPRELLEEMSERRFEEYDDPWSDKEWEWVREHDLDGYRPWDPNNVTEDFELGLFLWQEGYTPGYVDVTPTDEESPLSLHAWVRQRTRWKKGKIQTFLQYARHPPESLREKIHVYTQSAVPHLGPINLLSVIVILLGANLFGYQLRQITSIILISAFALALVMLGLYSYGYWSVSDKSRGVRLRRTAVVGLTLPFYWVLQWLADMRALKQAYSGEYHWAKTTHFGRNVNPDGGVRQGTFLGHDRDEALSVHGRLLALLGMLSLAAILRLYNFAEWSLYGDELYSITSRGALPIQQLLTVPLSLDSHPPFYYLVLHYWMDLFGNSVASARSLSVVFSLGAMVLLYKLGSELFDDRVGLLATLLFALSSFQVHYGRITRMYSLFAFLTLASWYGFVRLGDNGTRRSIFGYVVATALLIYTHVFGLFVLGAQHLYVLLSETKAGLKWRRWLKVQAIVGVFVMPWLLMLATRVISLLTSGSEGTIISWVPTPNVGIITHTILRYAGWPHHFPIINESWLSRTVAAVLVFIYVGCVVLSFIRFGETEKYEFTDIPKVGQLSTLFVVPIAAPFLVSFFVVPIYFPRFTLPASLALFLLVAVGILNISNRWRQVAVVALIVLCSLTLVGQYHATDTRADWEGAAACLNQNAGDGDAVLYQTFWIQNYVEYYQNTPGVEKFGVLSPDELTQNREYGRNLSQIRRLSARFDRIWLVQYQPSDENRIRSTLDDTHEVSHERDFGPLEVYLFQRDGKTENANTSCSGVSDSAELRPPSGVVSPT